jgi:hypothetical protein
MLSCPTRPAKKKPCSTRISPPLTRKDGEPEGRAKKRHAQRDATALHNQSNSKILNFKSANQLEINHRLLFSIHGLNCGVRY